LDEKVDLYNVAAVLRLLLGVPPAWRPGYTDAERERWKRNEPGFRHPDAKGALCYRGPAGTCEHWWNTLDACWQEQPSKRPTADQLVKQLEIILALSMANRENAGGKTNVLILGRGGKLTNDVLELVGTDPTSPCYDVTCKRVCDAPPLPPPPLAPAYPSEPSFPPFLGGLSSGTVRTPI
jgi:hypothetical protein